MGANRTPLSTRQAAKQLGVSSQTVRNWITAGTLRGYIVPGGSRACIRTDQQAVDEFWDRYSNQQNPENQSSKPIN
jgi:excisionase family DNA binding protein